MASCGLLNLASCLPAAFFDYITSFLNAPLQPLLTLVKSLISTNVDISLFSSLWAIIIYVLSMFYALLIIYAGFQFIISGYDPQKRESAKEWLRNIVIMIILIQASFFIYDLVLQISSVMTSTTMNLVGNNFFLLTIDSITNVALQILFFTLYILSMVISCLILIIRYGIVSLGVVLFPIAIFCYFVQPLRQYGILILNFLGVCIFITFIDAIIFVGFSKLVGISLFFNVKILVMIAAFSLVNLLMLFLMFFSVAKAAFSIGTKIAAVVATFA